MAIFVISKEFSTILSIYVKRLNSLLFLILQVVCLFVLFNLINGVMGRYFSTGNSQTLTAFQPFLADLSVIVAPGSLGYFMRHRFRVVYWYFITLLCTPKAVKES